MHVIGMSDDKNKSLSVPVQQIMSTSVAAMCTALMMVELN